ncbi:hypothetical protein AAAC51_20185 [Priestia megaterium]
MGIGRKAKPLIFSFEDWVKGEQLTITKIKGTVNTDEPFPFQ